MAPSTFLDCVSFQILLDFDDLDRYEKDQSDDMWKSLHPDLLEFCLVIRMGNRYSSGRLGDKQCVHTAV